MMHGMMMHGHGLHDSWGAGGVAVGVLWMVLLFVFWVLVITGLALLVRWLWRVTSERIALTGPVEILKARYARGELSRQEFEAMKRDLAG